ncbi:hypothetical protein ACELLULO517_07040 [Acidisoma cellulosilytica]|uniref:Uncharacterized protein n=1 Tax=Acidisoma cellulosilyticum TaxID=2802395 RepID=A0A963YZM2_9PROT|nr:hypothetical protein [Acidisoma cellulosilyticum]MCB8879985.1 hypothetical protein [Acidisoma cellulosilyticum]
MNNRLFADAGRQYDETFCSGADAGPGLHGTASVQGHMTHHVMTHEAGRT